MKRVLAMAGAAVIAASSLLSGCGSTTAGVSGTTAPTAAAEQAKSDKKIRIELMQGTWVGTPVGGADDVYKKWIDQTFNVDFVLTGVANFNEQVMVRFASGDAPDMVSSYDKDVLMKLHDQKMTLSDWGQYKDKIPSVVKGMSDAQRTAVSVNGKQALIGAASAPQNWSFKIRRDWLNNLGLKMPSTAEELLDVARKFTLNDPDKNGKNDTYAFTSAGGKQSIGEIDNLMCMFGPKDFYVTADKKVSHPMMDGNYEKFLNFMKTAVSEKLIDPDFMTVGWEDRKPKLFNGSYGIVWYPGVLVNETENGTGATGKTLDWWETMPMPKGADNGGKLPAGGLFATLKTVSAAAEKDKDKMDRILSFIEATTFPNDGYFKLRWGQDIDGYALKDAGDGYKFFNATGKKGVNVRGSYDGANKGLYDYGFSLATGADLVIEGSSDTLSDGTKKQKTLDVAAMKLPTYGQEAAMLNLDASTKDALSKMTFEFSYNYMTGKDTNFAAFKDKWLKTAGQKLLDDATTQFKKLGLAN